MTLSPLQGFTVGITAGRRADEQAELLQRRGATVIHGPAITTEYLGSDAALRAATDAVLAAKPTYLIATTGIGIRAWLEAAQSWGCADALVETLRATTVFARGPKAAGALKSAGLSVHVTAPTERLDELVEDLSMRSLTSTCIAFQHYGALSEAASTLLREKGARVIDVPVYRYGVPEDTAATERLIGATCEGEIDAITFTSAPAVHNFVRIAEGRGDRDRLIAAFNSRGVVAACVGPACAEAATELGIAGPVAPSVGRLGLLVRELDDALQRRRTALHADGASVVVQGGVVAVDDTVIELTPRERAVLDALIRRVGTVVSKTVLLHDVWSDQADAHAVEATIGRLRRRLGAGANALRSVRGRGYIVNAHTDPKWV
ncbi:MAG TPA: uroporphyrinogen-III synthase [Acidimicrobiales bacterium]|nr:uroporphyrinogen-III synthase [Acidimicrobiales bacterium]